MPSHRGAVCGAHGGVTLLRNDAGLLLTGDVEGVLLRARDELESLKIDDTDSLSHGNSQNVSCQRLAWSDSSAHRIASDMLPSEYLDCSADRAVETMCKSSTLPSLGGSSILNLEAIV